MGKLFLISCVGTTFGAIIFLIIRYVIADLRINKFLDKEHKHVAEVNKIEG